jgi:SAM-dependent methyltransferase
MSNGDYVLGTSDDEVDRLGLQHRVWRSRMLDAWRRAGVTLGQTFLDVGAGPGFAAIDAAEIVGRSGRILALERSPHFLAVLRDRATAAGLSNIEAREQDVAVQAFGEAFADRSWCRWLLSFVADPRLTVSHIARALKPGGMAIFHEYADYGTWQMLPPSADLDRFRALVQQSWRDAGGEPDIALRLPAWLVEEGFEIIEARPLIEIVGRKDLAWQWPASFMATNAARLAQLGYIDAPEAERLATTLDKAPATALMITPLVLELIARRR